MAADITETDLNRRHLLRGGAVLAGAAGIAVLGAAGAPKAAAADGEAVLQGADQSTTATTTLRIDEPDGGPDAALALGNANGPSLFLQPLSGDWDRSLEVGEITNTVIGPLMGLEDYSGQQGTGYLATNFDLDALPIPIAIPPFRLADTRTAEGREGIIDSSTGAFDASNRLKANAWMDIGLDTSDQDYSIASVFVNLTVVGSLAGGYLTAYPPGTRPNTSSLNFAKGQVLANAAFVQVGVTEGYFAIRIYVQATTHVLVDVTGVSFSGFPGPDAALVAKRSGRQGRRARAAHRTTRTLGKLKR
ncbi:MAG: hypothetical protein ABWX96_14030 [Propionibacteriaceae bacterium]